ncbi:MULTISPECIES: hypothetical protein [Paenibacillus]|uniref:hypothetical protein n=1 Tax=Paenibacillus TaxID=44249 RepID=UPI0005667335|nr:MULTISPECIES: hypothetical protein [Paenibacillus]MBV6714163.1 hypothetical protein [Paenibacillus chitinolyticus]
MGSYRGWERDNQASDGEFFVQIRALTLLKYAGVLAAIIIVNLIYQRFVNKNLPYDNILYIFAAYMILGIVKYVRSEPMPSKTGRFLVFFLFTLTVFIVDVLLLYYENNFEITEPLVMSMIFLVFAIVISILAVADKQTGRS